MTEDDGLTIKIAAEDIPDKDARASVVSFSEDANTAETVRSFGSSATRTIVVDAAEKLEGHRDSTSGNFIPGVKDVTKGVHDIAKNAKSYVRIFRGDDGIFEVNQEQLDRVRMSKCKMEG
jgi:23S rRNA U2552 (ribose-2'-O)-methylase RlmE/FtsJ